MRAHGLSPLPPPEQAETVYLSVTRLLQRCEEQRGLAASAGDDEVDVRAESSVEDGASEEPASPRVACIDGA